MSEVAIRIQHLGKQYHIGARHGSYKTLRESLMDVLVAPWRRARQVLRGQPTGAAAARDETIWALKDITLELKQGETVGLIGRNGAGKSTLLKILARITEPTEGLGEIHGRVGSLLEVGTGFHPELTGRENIFLNGAILGMKRREMLRQFDAIVDFADVEKFIDTPVKHYSSGMHMRLAFAVAAHLEPEILLVDEVLAVGDVRFQRKCLTKMQDIGNEGRTIIFVSHQMPAITRLCKRAILIEDGMLREDGPSHQVVSTYLSSGLGTTAMRVWCEPAHRPGGDIARLCAVCIRGEDGTVSDTIDVRQPVTVEMEYHVLTAGYRMLPHFHFHNDEGVHVFPAHDTDATWRGRPRPVGRYVSTVRIPSNLLTEGMLFIDAGLITLEPPAQQFLERHTVALHVVEHLDGPSARGEWGGRLPGVVRPLFQWDTQFEPQLRAEFPTTVVEGQHR